jgi:glycerophosphoryl diester phosphodiesterase
MDVEQDGAGAPRSGGRKWRTGLLALAGASVLLSLVNASWIAAQPPGRLVVVARHGIVQQAAPGAGCEARRLRTAEGNDYIEDTLPSIYRAVKLGADAVEVDVQASADGRAVLFRDPDLGCRTDGTGAVRDHSLEALKRLDVGYGYTADGGRTFPLRGRGRGAMPTVEEALREVPRTEIIFRFVRDDPAEADALVAALRRAGGADPARFGFEGPPAVTARVRGLLAGAWTFAPQQGGCVPAYFRLGWTGMVPGACRGTTVALTLADRWQLWGWPNRFLGRMAAADSRVLMFGEAKDGALVGITDVTQYEKVPSGFRGHLFVEDFYTVGAALRR